MSLRVFPKLFCLTLLFIAGFVTLAHRHPLHLENCIDNQVTICVICELAHSSNVLDVVKDFQLNRLQQFLLKENSPYLEGIPYKIQSSQVSRAPPFTL